MKSLQQKSLSPDESAHRFRIIQYKVRELQVGNVWRKFEEAGFPTILIKGWAAAQYYPEPFRRHFVDVDLMVSPSCFQAAEEFAKNIETSLPIDLHKGPRHLDGLEFEDIFSHAVFFKCGNVKVRVPCAEDHLRILCNHWLTDGGANREKLEDIFHVVVNRSENFDWNRLLNTVSFRRRRWVECAIGAAHKYSGLEIEDTPVSNGAKNLPQWFINALEKEWASGLKMQPLNIYLHDKKMFWKQLKKRLPPNPVQATVLQEGDFDKYPRIGYQIQNMFSRLLPSIKRIRQSMAFHIKS